MFKILVVEDDADTNTEITRLLRTMGETQVTSVYSRPEALELIEKNSYDLAVIDLDLGPENGLPVRYAGIALIPELAKTNTVTIVVSGLTEEAMPEVVLLLKAFDFVSKPFRHSDFLNKVRHALELKKVNTPIEADQAGDPPRRSNLQNDPDHTPGFLWRGKPIRMSLTQYRLVHKLLKTPGLDVTFAALAEEMDSSSSKAALATHFSAIRKKFLDLDKSFNALRPVPGRGYVWQED